MLEYTIIAEVPEELAGRFEDYMRSKHIPDVLATACFEGASIARSDSGEFRVVYRCGERQALEAYLKDHAAALRELFAKEFPFEASVSREVLEVIDTWGPDQS